MSRVAVNLLLYKPGAYLEPCLKSVFEQTYRDLELLIIDNGSGDDTVERAGEILKRAVQRSQRVPAHRIIANEKNSGFAAGHNQGIKESSGEFVFMLNQDIVLDPDYVKNIVKIFDGDEETGAAQGKLLRLKTDGEKFSKTQILDNTGLIFLKNRRIIARGQGQNDSGQFDKQEEIVMVDGAAPIFRRQALEDARICLNGQCEYLDEDFFMYKEDVDLGWRLRLAGWKAIYEPGSKAWHARTAGDSAKTDYLAVIGERRKISQFAKYVSFKNQRLMQIKNDTLDSLLKNIFHFLPKEIGAWIYVLCFERYTWKAIRELFRQAPKALAKRKIIMAKRKVGSREMEKWFK